MQKPTYKRQHGPTPRPDRELRTIRFNLLLTPAEHAELIINAGTDNRKAVSEYIRRQSLHRPARPSADNITVWRELAPVFSNLSQIAKHLNTGLIFLDNEMIADMNAAKEAVKQLRARLLS
jgi:hypothetical protein